MYFIVKQNKNTTHKKSNKTQQNTKKYIPKRLINKHIFHPDLLLCQNETNCKAHYTPETMLFVSKIS
ncbi:hypothetical protein CAP35_01645 [Chitinophagaceae bacterium IBVUCB1]|nr:hypothetical protein CAP35_01645 [Chitinophagaceae bacterium IBVUCB1]